MLNAFRHQRGSHFVGRLANAGPNACSTPFGIKEGRTNPRLLGVGRCVCAQRLSASKRVARAASMISSTCARSCSTPFGIKEGRTSQSLVIGVCRITVLNAFRHQRGSHSPPRMNRARCVRVLNAFRHQRGSHICSALMVRRCWRCSTPFGIKEGRTKPTGNPPRGGSVLNAFRHQRGSHPYWNRRSATFQGVLNAFRHQRGSHTDLLRGGF